MISFNLQCAGGHEFEGWFSSSKDYDSQRKRGLVSCPVCGDGQVSKALMAPNVGAKSNVAAAGAAAPAPADPGRTMQVSAPRDAGDLSAPDARTAAAAYAALRALQKKVEKECDFVGDRFAEEARRIHYGEAEERGIYGRSSPEDARALAEEGIDVSPIPWLPPEN